MTKAKRQSKTDRLAKALRAGEVDTMCVGDRAVAVTMRGGDRLVLWMDRARTEMLMETILVAAHRQDAVNAGPEPSASRPDDGLRALPPEDPKAMPRAQFDSVCPNTGRTLAVDATVDEDPKAMPQESGPERSNLDLDWRGAPSDRELE